MLKRSNVKMPKRGFAQLNPAKWEFRQRRNYLTGFTLIEIIISILVVTVGALAAYTVIQQIMSYTHQISSKLTAAYLAKEGIEIVRNIRDTNWLQGEVWDDGLNPGVGEEEWEADYKTIVFEGSGAGETCNPISNCRSYNGTFLSLVEDPLGSGNYFYGYGSSTLTKFKRRIAIDDFGLSSPDKLKVSVSVWWVEKGKTYGPITVQEILYNWISL